MANENKRDHWYWYNTGSKLFNNKDYENAVKAFKRSIQLGMDGYGIYFNLALSLYCLAGNEINLNQINLNIEARTIIDEAILRNPNVANSYKLKARILDKLADFSAAIEACDQTLRLNPFDREIDELRISLEDKKMWSEIQKRVENQTNNPNLLVDE